MVFSSIPFIFFFLPLFLILYYAFRGRGRNIVLLIFSLLFYAWGEPVYVFLMIAETLSDYIIGRLMERAKGRKRKCLLLWSVIFDLGVLGFFKYANFLIENINQLFRTDIGLLELSLPVGISFFTFQSLSYVIDCYHDEVESEHSYLNYLTYVCMFPQLVAGPIVRYKTIQQELHGRAVNWEEWKNGILRFLMGLFKKVLLANQIGQLWENASSQPYGGISVVAAWIGAVAYTFQIYFDFSGYSDMAIGLGRMMGFHFDENFNYPLYATSITDFWRRWHISLSGWFRNYVYIPLGGNRCSRIKQIRNIMVVWMLTGFWHGASWNFIFWGLYYGILLLLEKMVYGKYLEKWPKAVQHIYSFVIVVVGFVLFAQDNLAKLTEYMRSMIGLGGNVFASADVIWYLRNYGVILALCFILGTPVYQKWKERKPDGGAVQMALFAALFLLSIASLVNDSYNPFLYFRF